MRIQLRHTDEDEGEVKFPLLDIRISPVIADPKVLNRRKTLVDLEIILCLRTEGGSL